MRSGLLLLTLALALAPASSHAQTDERVALTGRVEGYAALRVVEEPAFLAARARAVASLRVDADRGRIVATARLTHSALEDDPPGTQGRVDLREAFAEAYLGPVDVRFGLQPVVWGFSEGIVVADLLAPLDLSDFLTEPADDLRLPLLALRATAFLGAWEPELVLVPRRPASRLPATDSPWNPLPRDVAGVPVVLTEPEEQDASLAAAEMALRLTWRGLPRTDLAAFWIHGFNRVPGFRKGLAVQPLPLPQARFTVTPTYRRRHVLGLGAETAALDPFVLTAEAAFHTRALFDERVDLPQTPQDLLEPDFQAALGRGFLLERPFVTGTVGLGRALGSQFLRAQAALAYVVRHDARVAQPRTEATLTALWVGRFARQTLTVRAFGLYVVGRDVWFNPEATYAVQDGLNVALGAQVFGGGGPRAGDLEGLLREPGFRFSAFRGNSLAYVRATYAF